MLRTIHHRTRVRLDNGHGGISNEAADGHCTAATVQLPELRLGFGVITGRYPSAYTIRTFIHGY
jgi:hypothetical protein